jgi:hypothetical protein
VVSRSLEFRVVAFLLRKSEVGHDQQKEKTMRDFGGHVVFFFFFFDGRFALEDDRAAGIRSRLDRLKKKKAGEGNHCQEDVHHLQQAPGKK